MILVEVITNAKKQCTNADKQRVCAPKSSPTASNVARWLQRFRAYLLQPVGLHHLLQGGAQQPPKIVANVVLGLRRAIAVMSIRVAWMLSQMQPVGTAHVCISMPGAGRAHLDPLLDVLRVGPPWLAQGDDGGDDHVLRPGDISRAV